eukprot:TRINITY_DN26088_c0_g1_i1.p1 TRINITY_DN26088_c0_g1~~TRINITY_DN26088_c0_g1_i1.p1  ORF type:complete len:165 (+),score=58.45 TRINITY_DN26088_c0_g1_i1:273-767(+)
MEEGSSGINAEYGGEYVAATVSGVLTLDDALKLIVTRGQLMQEQPSGLMLVVKMEHSKLGEKLKEYLTQTAANGEKEKAPSLPIIDIAARNSPEQVVVSGEDGAILGFSEYLVGIGVKCKILENVSHGFHSRLLQGMLPKWKKEAVVSTQSTGGNMLRQRFREF